MHYYLTEVGNIEADISVSMLNLLSSLKVRSLIALTLVGGSVALAVIDPNYRGTFSQLAQIGLAGYFGLSVPEDKR